MDMSAPTHEDIFSHLDRDLQGARFSRGKYHYCMDDKTYTIRDIH